MRAQRRDANEAEILMAARKLGVYMVQARPLDWWGLYGSSWKCIEIKGPKGKYTPAQIVFLAECLRRNGPQLTWRTVDDVVTSVETWRSQA